MNAINLSGKTLPPIAARARLQQMIDQAVRIMASAGGKSAVTLEVFRVLSSEEIDLIAKGSPLEQSSIDRIGKEIGRRPQVVIAALSRHIVPDILDFSDSYTHQYNEYLRHKDLYTQSALLIAHLELNSVDFIYHGSIYSWAPSKKDLSIQRLNNQALACVYGGALVEQGLVFSTSVGLLEASCRKKWINWDALWSFF
jgi:hypothetical protein